MPIVVLVVAIIALLVIVKSCIIVVKQQQAVIIESFGKYSRTLSPGLNFIIPMLDAPRPIITIRKGTTLDGRMYSQPFPSNVIVVRETVYDFPRQNVITKDNVSISINALLYFQIMDPKSAVYEIQNKDVRPQNPLKISCHYVSVDSTSTLHGHDDHEWPLQTALATSHSAQVQCA